MDHIENEGRKGYCLLYFFVFLILFIGLWAWIYYSNTKLEF